MSQINTATSWEPRVFVGAPTGSLNPQIPSPVYRPCPVAIEIADGIGFAIDGESLIVDDGVREGVTTIAGHLDDGTYPQRDFVVTRSGNDTSVEGYYDWQKYGLRRDDNVLHIDGDSESESSTVTQTVNSIVVDGAYPAQRYYVGVSGADVVTVDSGDPNAKAEIVYHGDHISINSDIPERCFEITKTPGGLHVQGHYRFQDFDVTYAPDGFTIQGLYPQQKYVVTQG